VSWVMYLPCLLDYWVTLEIFLASVGTRWNVGLQFFFTTRFRKFSKTGFGELLESNKRLEIHKRYFLTLVKY